MAYSRERDDDCFKIHAGKLPRGRNLKFASPKANRVDCSFNYFGNWESSHWRDRLPIENSPFDLRIEAAVKWLHANATGEWQYRVEDTMRNIPPSTSLMPYKRHFIRFQNKDDALLFKLSGL